MDSRHDSLGTDRPYRLFDVIDDVNREDLCIDDNFSLAADRFIGSS